MHQGVSRCFCTSGRRLFSGSFGAGFDRRPPRMSAVRRKSGLFGHRLLAQPAGFYDLTELAKEDCYRLVQEAVSSSRARLLVHIFDDLSDRICRIADMAECMRIAHPRADYRHTAMEASISLNEFVEQLNTDESLYRSLKQVVDNGDPVAAMDDIDRTVAGLFLVDFEKSGVHLDGVTRSKFVQLNTDLIRVASLFSHVAGQPSFVSREQLSDDVKRFFGLTNKQRGINISAPYFDTEREDIRRLVYEAYMRPSEEGLRYLHQLVEGRYELARLVGFGSFADRMLVNTMAQKSTHVHRFLHLLCNEFRTRIDNDFNIIDSVAGSSAGRLPWNATYFAGRLKASALEKPLHYYRSFLSLGACMNGINMLLNSLFNLEMRHEVANAGEVWDSTVYKLGVYNRSDQSLIGYIYCDFFDRPDKPKQDCHFTLLGGRQLANEYQKPVVALMFSLPGRFEPEQEPLLSERFAPPSNLAAEPCLLWPDMASNLFHEFGHAIHSMLARTRYQHVTGTRCSTDFAEVPSILMEFFFNDARVLTQFARHYQSGQRLSLDDAERLCRSRAHLAGIDLQQQLLLSGLDMRLHGDLHQSFPDRHDNGVWTNDAVRLVRRSVPGFGNTGIDVATGQCRFSHLATYGAKYYSYLWSRAVASMLWQRKFRNDPFSGSVGLEYWNKVLAHGGGKAPWAIVAEFLEMDINEEVLAKSLAQSVGVVYE